MEEKKSGGGKKATTANGAEKKGNKSNITVTRKSARIAEKRKDRDESHKAGASKKSKK